MDKNEALFTLWHATVLGLAAVAVVLGYADALLGGMREIVVAIMAGLYVLGVALSAVRMRQFRHGVSRADAAHQLQGIALIGSLLVSAGPAGTVAGLMLGTSGITADVAADAAASRGMVGGFIDGFGIALWATLPGIVLNCSLRIGARFVANVAHANAS